MMKLPPNASISASSLPKPAQTISLPCIGIQKVPSPPTRPMGIFYAFRPYTNGTTNTMPSRTTSQDPNTMPDDASRLHNLSDLAFFNHFNSTYPQPQSWCLWTPTPYTSCHDLRLAHLVPALPMLNGISGSPSVKNSEWILDFRLQPQLGCCSNRKTLQAGPYCHHLAHTHGCAPFRQHRRHCGCGYDCAGGLFLAPSGRIHHHGLRHYTLPHVL
jgi:hypothetical protein